MHRKIIPLVTIAVTFCGVAHCAFAQQPFMTPREEVMLFALDTLQAEQGKKEAMRSSMQETQMTPGEVKPAKPRGEGTMKFLKSRSHPYVNLSIAHDNNYDDLEHDAKGQQIYSGQTGLKMNFTGRDKAINFDTHLNGDYHSDRTIDNDIDVVTGFAGYMNIGKYIWSAFESYNNNYIAGIEELNARSPMEVDGRRWSNTFTTTLGRYFNRTGFDLGYTRQDIDYESDYSVAEDRYVDTFKFNQYLRVASKTRLLLGYYHERTKYRKHLQIDNVDDVNFGVTGALSAKLTYLVRADYKEQDEKGSSSGFVIEEFEDNEDYQGDWKDVTFTGNIGYQYSNRTNANLTYNYIIHKDENNVDEFTANGFTLSANHRLAFNPKFNLSANFGAELRNYAKNIGNVASVDTYNWGMGLSYAFRKWIDFSFGWGHERVTSNRYWDNPYDKDVFQLRTNTRF